MAERSKACDSSESLPASAGFSSGYPGVGSNPTLVNFLVSQIQKTHFWTVETHQLTEIHKWLAFKSIVGTTCVEVVGYNAIT